MKRAHVHSRRFSHGMMIVTHFSLFCVSCCFSWQTAVESTERSPAVCPAYKLPMQRPVSKPCCLSLLQCKCLWWFFFVCLPYRARNEPALPRSIYLCAHLLSPLLWGCYGPALCAYVIVHTILPPTSVILWIELVASQNGFHWILDTMA